MSDAKRVELLSRLARIDRDIATFEDMLRSPNCLSPTTTRWEVKKLEMLHDKTMSELKSLDAEQ